GISHRAKSFRGERALVEIRVIRRVANIRSDYQASGEIRMVHAAGPGERTVATLRERDGETSGETCNPVQTPTLNQPPGRAWKPAVPRHGVVIAEDEIVSVIEGRQSPAQVKIGVINGRETGSVVHGFAKGICGQKREIAGAPFHGDLQRV